MSMLKILRTSRALAVAAACIGIFTLGIQQAQATVITSGCSNTNVFCTLDELDFGGTITVNDKLFDNWDFIANTGGFALDRITVTGLTDLGNDPGPGLRYEGNGAMRVEAGIFNLFAFSFRVSVVDPTEFLIKDNTLDLTDFSFGQNVIGGTITIQELVDDTDPPVTPFLATKLVNAFSDGGGTPTATPPDFSPQEEILVLTTINLLAAVIPTNTPDQDIELISFEQRFSQEPQGVSGPPGGVIPEPGTLSLLGIGLAGLALHQWRRKKGASQ